eukprot:6209618-Pleurochrysis_carterae.AAC.3
MQRDIASPANWAEATPSGRGVHRLLCSAIRWAERQRQAIDTSGKEAREVQCEERSTFRQ